MLLRIVDKETFVFIRDDFSYDEEKEIGLDVQPAEGYIVPKWNGVEWVEGYLEGMLNPFIVEE